AWSDPAFTSRPYHIRLGLISRRVPCAPVWPSSKPSVKAKNGFQPDFLGQGPKLIFRIQKSPLRGVRISTRICPSTKLPCDALHRASPDPEGLGYPQHTHALCKLPSHLACGRVVYLRPTEFHTLGDGALSCASCPAMVSIRTVCRHCLAN